MKWLTFQYISSQIEIYFTLSEAISLLILKSYCNNNLYKSVLHKDYVFYFGGVSKFWKLYELPNKHVKLTTDFKFQNISTL